MSDREPHRLVVDRFEGDLVVVEVDGDRFLDLPRWLLPSGLREGDVVTAQDEAGEGEGEGEERRILFTVDRAATQRARQETEALLTRLRRRDPGGDIQL